VNEHKHLVLKEEEDGVVVLVLKNPPVNALSTGLLTDLEEVVGALAKDRSKRAVILTGEGSYFSAGADLKEMAGMVGEFRTEAPKVVARGHRLFRALEDLPMPVIAAINGLALGGGLELALSCDLRVAGDTAKLGATEVSFGLIPAYGGTQRLPRLVGLAKAKELVFSATMIPASEGLKWGLVNRTVPAGQELRAARDLAHTIAQKAPRAVAAAKAAIQFGYDHSLEEGLRREAELFSQEVLPSEDLLEGIAAFVERRPPKFTGR
jgi:enoyl-CoA hydratase/carnithine racemase